MAAAAAAAGISESDAQNVSIELDDDDDATVHYDIEFIANGKEYSYNIDATTGAVIDVDESNEE